MADFDSLLINAAVYGQTCTYCDANLVDKASLKVASGFDEIYVCTDCIIKVFNYLEEIPIFIKKYGVLLGRIDKLEGKKDAPKPEPKPESKPGSVKKTEASGETDVLPKVSSEGEVRPASESG
jgi:hypothetical protein